MSEMTKDEMLREVNKWWPKITAHTYQLAGGDRGLLIKATQTWAIAARVWKEALDKDPALADLMFDTFIGGYVLGYEERKKEIENKLGAKTETVN